jgi:ComF family protein
MPAPADLLHKARLSLWPWLRRQSTEVLNAWPGLCPVCDAWASGARCVPCRQRFAAPRASCPRCAVPWAGGGECPACRRHPPWQVATVAAVAYTEPWRTLIPALKFQGRLDHVPWLAALLVDAVRAAPMPEVGPVSLVTAVPLSDARLRERGFNQAGQIARHVARALGVPYDVEALLRWRSTGKQTALDRAQRLQNLGQAFMPHPLARARLQGQHVALVDDVLTTGATLRAAGQALLEGRARAVSLWVVARTPSPREVADAAAQALGGDNAPHVPHRPGST